MCMKVITLNGFEESQWRADRAGTGFQARMRRKVQRIGGKSTSVEVRDGNGRLLDYYTCPAEIREFLRG